MARSRSQKIKKMLKIIAFAFLIAVGIPPANSQFPTQEQCQQADAQLNQVYKQLMGSLNDAQKKAWIAAQRRWLTQRNAFVAQNPGNPQGALYQATMLRVAQLNAVLRESSQLSGTQPISSSSDQRTHQSIQGIQQQEQCKRTDAQLNEAYNQLMGMMNDKQKDQLRKEQTIWIKERDALIRNNPNNVAGAFNYATEKRIKVLNQILKNQSEKSSEASSNRVTVVPQVFPSDQGVAMDENDDYVVIGCDSPNWTSYALLFDKKSNLLIRKFDLGQFSIRGLSLPKRGNWMICQTWDKNDGNSVRIFSLNEPIAVDSQNDNQGDQKNQKIPEIKADQAYLEDDNRIIYKKFAPGGQLADCFYEKDIDKNGFISNEKKVSGYVNSKTNPLFPALIDREKISQKTSLFKFKSRKTCLDELNKLQIEGCQFVRLESEKQFQRLDLFSGRIIPSGPTTNPNTLWKFSPFQKISDKYFPNGTRFIEIRPSDLPERTIDSFLVDESCSKETITSFGGDAGVLCASNNLTGAIYPISGVRDSVALWSFLESDPQRRLITTSAHLRSYNCAPAFMPSLQIRNADNGKLLFKTDDWNSICFSGDKMYCSKNDRFGQRSGLDIYNATTFQHERDLPNIIGMDPIAVSENRLGGTWKGEPSVVRLYDLHDGHQLCSVTPSGDASLLMYTPDNYYMTGQGKFSPVAFRIQNKAYPLEQFDLRLNRPDIVLQRLGAPKEAIEAAKTLREKRLKKMNVTEEMLQPDFHLPEVALTSEVPSTTSSDQIDLKIKATDDKYPLERFRVYVNNVPINGTEGESLRDQKTQSLERTIPIKLASGRNKIQVSVLNSAGAESLYANAEVTCTAQRPKPNLYVVSMGVSNYANPDNNLKYAAKDADDLAKKLKGRAGSLYGEVKELVLKDQDVSRENLVKVREFLKPATIDDSVVLFMAGHGLLDDKYDYYFGTSDIDPAHPEQRGIPFEEMDEILASLPCLKKSMLVDTCHAGELDADEKKQLAASDASAQGVPVTTDAGNGAKVAMRAIGTRGMQVKAVEGSKGRNDWYERLQDMFVDLRRGSGSTILSSSEGAEYAYESSDQQNGLFTYALMEALDGKGHPADAKSPEVTMSEVAEYVKKRVGDLTNHKQTPNARRVNLEGDFALGTTK